MKFFKYTFIGILLLVGFNLITFYLFGKQSLRNRNVSEMMKTDFENWRNVRLDYNLVSNLDIDSKFYFNGKEYPVFSNKEFLGNRFDAYEDSMRTSKRLRLSFETVGKILNTNLDSLNLIDEGLVDSTLYLNFETIALELVDSIQSQPHEYKIGGECGTFGSSTSIECFITENELVTIWEEIKTNKTLFVEQELIAITLGSDFEYYREEKLIWLFFTWIQIEFIDGNGLGDDIPSWER